MVRQQMKLGFSIIEWSTSSENVDALSRRQNKMSSASTVVVSQLEFIELSYQNYAINHSTTTIHLVNVNTSTFC